MTVSEVIEELKRCPGHVPVTAVLGSVWMQDEENKDGAFVPLNDTDSREVTDVKFEGNQVLLWADGMRR